jgi:hypothetical protein
VLIKNREALYKGTKATLSHTKVVQNDTKVTFSQTKVSTALKLLPKTLPVSDFRLSNFFFRFPISGPVSFSSGPGGGGWLAEQKTDVEQALEATEGSPPKAVATHGFVEDTWNRIPLRPPNKYRNHSL